jgi:hypothetical protein
VSRRITLSPEEMVRLVLSQSPDSSLSQIAAATARGCGAYLPAKAP